MDVLDDVGQYPDPLPEDPSDDECEVPPSSGPGSTPTSCTSSPPQGEEPASPHGTIWAGTGAFFGTTASAPPFSRTFFSRGRGPGRPKKEGFKLTKDGKVVKRSRGGSAGSVRGVKRQRVSRDDSLDDFFDEGDFTVPVSDEPPFFPEKWPGKQCALCNLTERSQLGQGEMRQYSCQSSENCQSRSSTPNAPSGSCTPTGGSTPNQGLDSVLMSPPHGDDSQGSTSAPLSRRQKGVNKCKTPLYNMEHTDELSIIGYAESMELSTVITLGFIYLHKNCFELSPSGRELGITENGEDLKVKNIVTSALQKKCTFCSRFGASLTCKMNCNKFYHFPCLLASGGYLDFNIKASFCKEHLYQVPVICSSDVNCRNCEVVGDIANLMTCSTCGAHYHGTCVGLAQTPGVRAGWQCRGCRVCQVCRGEGDARSAACDQCDKLYHASCLRPPMATVPKYGWKCKCCRVCSDCGSRSPGAGPSSRWHAHYTVCDSCYQQRNKGSCCPLCRRAYRAAAQKDMIRCTICKRYVHASCDPDADPIQYQAKKEKSLRYEYVCLCCKPSLRTIIHDEDLNDSMTSQDESLTMEQDPLATDSKPDIGLGKGKPFSAVSTAIAKKKLSSYKNSGSFVASGKLAYQKRQNSNFIDFSKKKTKTKMRGIFGVPGLGLQRPQPSLDTKPEDDTTAENKMILVSRDDKWVLSQDICVMCGAIGTDAEGCLIACSQCGQTYHPYCVNVKLSKVVVSLGWRCLDCTVCEGCGRRGDEPRLLLCDDCDATYHTYCATPALTNVPKGAWKCGRCRRCTLCGSTTPGPNQCMWQEEYSTCAPCHSANVCPVCSRNYGLGDLVIQCDVCTRWLHAGCDSIHNEEEAEMCCKIGYKCSACRGGGPPMPALVPAPPAPPPALPLADLGLCGEFYVDEVCLSARGAAAVRALQADIGMAARRKRRTNKQDNDNDSAMQGEADEREDGEIKEEPLPDSMYKEGSAWEAGVPPPQGFSTYTTEAGNIVLRRKRTRNLNKLGVGGFLVRSRLKHEEEDGPCTPQTNGQQPVIAGSQTGPPGPPGQPLNESPSNKRKPRRKLRSKLMETYPPYIQEAFFGKDLIDPKMPVTPSESPSSTTAPIPSTPQTPDAYQNFFGKLDFENSDSETEDVTVLTTILHEYDSSSIIELDEEQKVLLKNSTPSTTCNEVEVKLEPTDDSNALDHALKGTAPPKQSTPTPSSEGGGGTQAPKEEMSLLNVNLDPLPNMDSTDVDEIFKGVLTDDSQESQESNYSSYPPRGQLTSPMEYASPYHSTEFHGNSQLSPAFSEGGSQVWAQAEQQMPATQMQQSHMPQQVPGVPPQMQQSLQQPPGMATGMLVPQQGQVALQQPTTTYNQRSTEKMRADESLGAAATISAVLYANTNHPEWKSEFPNWSERCKQILKKWRALPGEQKAPYLQQARDNRSAIRMKKAQQGVIVSGGETTTSGSTVVANSVAAVTSASPAVVVVTAPTTTAVVSSSSVVVRAPNVTVVGEAIRVLTPSEIMRTLPRLHTEQERAAAAQRSARDIEQERAWKQRQARQQHDQRQLAGTTVGGETPRAAFPAARFPLHYAPRHMAQGAAQMMQGHMRLQGPVGQEGGQNPDIDRQLIRDLLQQRGKVWQGNAENQFRQPLPVARPQMPIPNQNMGKRMPGHGDIQRPIGPPNQGQGHEKSANAGHEGSHDEMDMSDIDKLDQDILGDLGGDDDEELLVSLTAEMGDDFNILEYADPELDAFSDAHTAQILDALDLPEEPERREKGEIVKTERKPPTENLKVDKDIKLEENAGEIHIKQEDESGEQKMQDNEMQGTMTGKTLPSGKIMHMQSQGHVIKMQGNTGKVIQMQNAQGQLIQMHNSQGKVIQMQSGQMQLHQAGANVVQAVNPMQNSGILQQNLSQLPPEALSQVLRSAPAPVRSIIRPYGQLRPGQPRQILTAGTLAYHPLNNRAPPPPPYPGHRAAPPPPPYPQHHQGAGWPANALTSHKPLLLQNVTQEQPLLLEDLLEQEKREQERQSGWATPVAAPVAHAPPVPAPAPLFTAPPPPAPPVPTQDSDRATVVAYELWLRRQQAYLADQLKHYEAEVQKLRKIRKSLNSKQRQLRKSGNELAPNDAAELARISTEQAVLQKHLESARKQFRQHTTLDQEYQTKMQRNNPQLQQGIVQGHHQIVNQQQLVGGQMQNVTAQHQLVGSQMQNVSGQHQMVSGQIQTGPSAQHQMIQNVSSQIQSGSGQHQILTGQIGFVQQGPPSVRNVRVPGDSPLHPHQSPLQSPMQSPLQSPMQSQSPLHPHRSPAQSPMHHPQNQFHQQSPLHAQQSPMQIQQQSPMQNSQQTMHQQSPMQQSPMHHQQSPMHHQQSPVHQQQNMMQHSPLISPQQQQMNAIQSQQMIAHSPQPPPQSPHHPPQSPLHPPQSPLPSPMQSPLHASQSPLHAVASPLHSVASPGRQMSSPQHLLQQLQRTSPQLPPASRSPQFYQQTQMHSPIPSQSPQLQNVQSSFQRPSSASPLQTRFSRAPHQQGMRVGVVYAGKSPLGSPQPMMSPGHSTSETVMRQTQTKRQFSPSSPHFTQSPAPPSPDVSHVYNPTTTSTTNDSSHGGGFSHHTAPFCAPPPGYRYSRLGLFGGSPVWPQDEPKRTPHITKVSILKRKPRPNNDDDVVVVDDERIATEEDFEELIDGGTHEEEEVPRPPVRTETTTKTVAVISLAAKRPQTANVSQPFKLANVSIANQTISVPVLKGFAVAGASRARSPVRPTPSNKPIASVISVISTGAGGPRVATLSPVIALATSTASRVPVSILSQHQVKQKIVKTIEKPTILGLSSIGSTLSHGESIFTTGKQHIQFRKDKPKHEMDIEKEITQHTELPPTLIMPERSCQSFLKPDIKSPDRIPETIPDNIMEGDDEDKPEDLPKSFSEHAFTLQSSSPFRSKDADVDTLTTIKAIANQTQDVVIDSNMQMTSEISQESVQISIPSPTPSQEQYLNRITMQQHHMQRDTADNESKEVGSIEDMLSILDNIDAPKMFGVNSSAVENAPAKIMENKEKIDDAVTEHDDTKPKLEAKLTAADSQLSPLSQPAELTSNMANVSQQLRSIMSSLTTSKQEVNQSSASITKNSPQSSTHNQVNFENLLPSSKVETSRVDIRGSMQRMPDKNIPSSSSDNSGGSSLIHGSRVNALSSVQGSISPSRSPSRSPAPMSSPLSTIKSPPPQSPLVSNSVTASEESSKPIITSQQVIQMPFPSKVQSLNHGPQQQSLNILNQATGANSLKSHTSSTSILSSTLQQPSRQTFVSSSGHMTHQCLLSGQMSQHNINSSQPSSMMIQSRVATIGSSGHNLVTIPFSQVSKTTNATSSLNIITTSTLLHTQLTSPLKRSKSTDDPKSEVKVGHIQPTKRHSVESVIVKSEPMEVDSCDTSVSGHVDSSNKNQLTPQSQTFMIQQPKNDESQNVLLKQLLQTSSAGNPMPPVRGMTLPRAAPALGSITSLEAQLARPSIPPPAVPVIPEIPTQRQIVSRESVFPVRTIANSVTTSSPHTSIATTQSNVTSLHDVRKPSSKPVHKEEVQSSTDSSFNLQVSNTQLSSFQINQSLAPMQQEIKKEVLPPHQSPVSRPFTPLDVKKELFDDSSQQSAASGVSTTSDQSKMDIKEEYPEASNMDVGMEGTQAETPQEAKKRKRREYQQKRRQMQNAKNTGTPVEGGKRARIPKPPPSRYEEDYDTFIEKLMVQLRQLPPMQILEPTLTTNFAVCPLFGSGDLTKLKNKEYDLMKGDLVGEFGNARIPNVADHYNTKPFGDEEPLPEKPPVSTQRGFYDQEFPPIRFEDEKSDKKYDFICRERDTDTPDTIVSCSSPEPFDLELDLGSRFPGLKTAEDETQEDDDCDSGVSGRISPVIPLIAPVPLRLKPGVQIKEEPETQLNNSLELETLKVKPESPGGSETAEDDVTVTLTLTSGAAEDIVGVLKKLADLLHIPPPTTYRIIERTATPPSHKLGLYRAKGRDGKEAAPVDIQSILNGAAKFCRHCDVVILDSVVRAKASEFPSLAGDRAALEALGDGELCFCSTRCYERFAWRPTDLLAERDSHKDSKFRDDGNDFDARSTESMDTDELDPKREIKEEKADLSMADSMDADSEDDQKEENPYRGVKYKFWAPGKIVPPTRYRKPGDRELAELVFREGPAVPPIQALEDMRKCALCGLQGDGVADGASRLLNCETDKWVHLNCALWSDGVYETVSGALVNTETALTSGAERGCIACGRLGASVKCFKTRCGSAYHVGCASKEGVVFHKNKSAFCSVHAPKGEKDNELTTLSVRRRVWIARDETLQTAGAVRTDGVLRVGAVIALRIGHLPPMRAQAFHTPDHIFPVGYKVIRFYWSTKKINSRCRYLCWITDSEGKPEFHVAEDGIEESETKGSTPRAAWSKILDAVAALRETAQQGVLKLWSHFVTGEDLFGLTEPAIVRLLESLPGVETLTDYKFKFGRSALLEAPLAINPHGCARCEPRCASGSAWRTPGGGIRRPRAAPPILPTVSSGDLLSACPYSKQFVHTKSSQYKKMKMEWRNNVYLARSKIQGLGLYAARDIEKHTMVIEYIGEVIRSELSEIREKQYEAKNRGVYMFRLDERRVVDATLCGGLARYINHSCAPNCVAEVVEVDRDLRIIIFAKRKIPRGEELAYDYKFDIEDDAHKIPCMCGASNCQKWMN